MILQTRANKCGSFANTSQNMVGYIGSYSTLPLTIPDQLYLPRGATDISYNCSTGCALERRRAGKQCPKNFSISAILPDMLVRGHQRCIRWIASIRSEE